MATDYEGMLVERYRALIEQHGMPGQGVVGYRKSHWDGCDRSGRSSCIMPTETPAKWISCNTCLINRGYIRIVQCDPRLEGWPSAECGLCEQGVDHETWLMVKGVGEGVEQALRHHIDPDAEHPVTWADVGCVPFMDAPNPTFGDKAELDTYWACLQARYSYLAEPREMDDTFYPWVG